MTDTDFDLIPSRIVEELDKYIVGQTAAKRNVAIALRNRWRRHKVDAAIRSEIMPNNIILIGPTGVGKTEIARRISKLTGAPFIKVEASKFTEVGYVGRDVESMVRELMNYAISQVREQMVDSVQAIAREKAENRVLDILLPPRKKTRGQGEHTLNESYQHTRQKLHHKMLSGTLDDKEIEIEPDHPQFPVLELVPNPGMEMMETDIGEILASIMPGKPGAKKIPTTVGAALKKYTEQEISNLISKEKMVDTARQNVEEKGIIFIDEIDKIASIDRGNSLDVSRSGVQRDLLPIVEGSKVPTKYGMIDTSHILFIAAGAFHSVKPSDLIPELQGRFPIRVELNSLNQDDFCSILTEPENSLVKQYQALFQTEGVKLGFTSDAIQEIAYYAALANEKMEDIGARRLHTVMNALLDDYLFSMPCTKIKQVKITRQMVSQRLAPVIESDDLSRFIL